MISIPYGKRSLYSGLIGMSILLIGIMWDVVPIYVDGSDLEASAYSIRREIDHARAELNQTVYQQTVHDKQDAEQSQLSGIMVLISLAKQSGVTIESVTRLSRQTVKLQGIGTFNAFYKLMKQVNQHDVSFHVLQFTYDYHPPNSGGHVTLWWQPKHKTTQSGEAMAISSDLFCQKIHLLFDESS